MSRLTAEDAVAWLIQETSMSAITCSLTEDFEYDGDVEKHDLRDFLIRMEHHAKFLSPTFLFSSTWKDGSAVLLEATDSTTEIRYRIAWMLEYEGDLIRRIFANKAMLGDFSLANQQRGGPFRR